MGQRYRARVPPGPPAPLHRARPGEAFQVLVRFRRPLGDVALLEVNGTGAERAPLEPARAAGFGGGGVRTPEHGRQTGWPKRMWKLRGEASRPKPENGGMGQTKRVESGKTPKNASHHPFLVFRRLGSEPIEPPFLDHQPPPKIGSFKDPIKTEVAQARSGVLCRGVLPSLSRHDDGHRLHPGGTGASPAAAYTSVPNTIDGGLPGGGWGFQCHLPGTGWQLRAGKCDRTTRAFIDFMDSLSEDSALLKFTCEAFGRVLPPQRDGSHEKD